MAKKNFLTPNLYFFFTFHPKYHLLFYYVFLLPENNDLDLLPLFVQFCRLVVYFFLLPENKVFWSLLPLFIQYAGSWSNNGDLGEKKVVAKLIIFMMVRKK